MKEKILCDCGHSESEHSDCTRGYGVDRDGKTMCYPCCLAKDLAYLKREGNLSAYISSDGSKVTTWSGDTIATITKSRIVNLGFRRNQISFTGTLADGTPVYGYGPGKGMFCRVKLYKN